MSERDLIVAKLKGAQNSTLSVYSKISEVPASVLAVTKDCYLLFAEFYNQSVWSSYPLWINLYDSQKLFWVNYVQDIYKRVSNA